MPLEDLLGPLKYVDEAILKQYAKISRYWEEKRESRYSLALGCDILFIAGVMLARKMVSSAVPAEHVPNIYAQITSLAMIAIQGNNFCHTLSNLMNPPDYGLDVEDKHNYVTTKINRLTRLPMFIGLTGLSIYAGITYEGSNWRDYVFCGVGAISFLSIASSMYIKDADSEILDKEPSLVKAFSWLKEKYHGAKEKVEKYLPRPASQPVPVQYKNALMTIN